jgi:hypothetical protein
LKESADMHAENDILAFFACCEEDEPKWNGEGRNRKLEIGNCELAALFLISNF